MEMKPSVYLAGGIFNLSDEEAKNWREKATKILAEYDIMVRDPMIRDYRGVEDMHVKEIVEEDKNDILNSSIVLARVEVPSWGTGMELMFSYIHKIPVVAFTGKYEGTVSPWIQYHTIQTSTLENALAAVILYLTGLHVDLNEKK